MSVFLKNKNGFKNARKIFWKRTSKLFFPRRNQYLRLFSPIHGPTFISMMPGYWWNRPSSKTQSMIPYLWKKRIRNLQSLSLNIWCWMRRLSDKLGSQRVKGRFNFLKIMFLPHYFFKSVEKMNFWVFDICRYSINNFSTWL